MKNSVNTPKCKHDAIKVDRLPLLKNWFYCHKCKSPFQVTPKKAR